MDVVADGEHAVGTGEDGGAVAEVVQDLLADLLLADGGVVEHLGRIAVRLSQ